MLKLTSTDAYRGSIYIAVAHITMIQSTHSGTKVWVSGGNCEIVRELTSEILGMPQMMATMHVAYAAAPLHPIDQLAEALKAEKMA